MPEAELKTKLHELGFISKPNLPGDPDFAHFDAKLALCVFSRASLEEMQLDERIKFNRGFHERFAGLRLKKWHCRIIYKEDTIEKTVDHINAIMVRREFAKIKTPSGPEPTHKKLIQLLKQTDEALVIEEKKRRPNSSVIWGLKERRKNIERWLHSILKPAVLKRDNYMCRECGSSVENLQLARLVGGDNAIPEMISRRRTVWHYPDAEKRWADENFFILCKDCHRQLDSLWSRLLRRSLGETSVEQTIELLKSGQLRRCYTRKLGKGNTNS
jgi:5-methylcytosine-specific restriction endonuclease McrA